MAADATKRAYRNLLDRVRRISNVGEASSVLDWDQKVMMPAGGTKPRSAQLSTLSGIKHDLLTADETARLLGNIDEAALSETERAVLREVSREYHRAAAVPTALIEKLTEATSKALPVWEDARESDDYAAFEPTLERIVELRRQYAEHIDPDRDPYEVLFEEYEPYLGLETADRILNQLREGLGPLIETANRSDGQPGRDFEGTFAISRQETVARAALTALGYDWDRGRLDTSTHPFSMGNMYDARITTRYDESTPFESLSSTIHEYGHAAYSLGLPEEWYGTPIGEPRDLTIHESQSRFWENHIGRSKGFWQYFLPTVKEEFPALAEYSVTDIFGTINRMYPENPIRVEADEVTYHMHIVVRYEIEQGLLRGEIGVDEVPGLWNEKMEAYLGLTPESDSVGCLQDIHWSGGSFGYFPTYSLGSVLAAQLDATARQDLNEFEAHVTAGEFGPILGWLREHIHRHGARYTTPELIQRATGQGLQAQYFLEYVDAKVKALYGK